MGILSPLYMLIINPIIKSGNGKFYYGGFVMIIFDRLWETMKEKGISTYTLREKYNIDSRTIRRLRANENVTTNTLNTLCEILDCGLQDIAEYVKD